VTIDAVEQYIQTAAGETGYADAYIGGMTEAGSPVDVIFEGKQVRQTWLSNAAILLSLRTS
jgi:hypothetical protein